MTHHLRPHKLLSKTDLFLPILKGLSSNIVSVGIKQNMVLIPAPFQNNLGKKKQTFSLYQILRVYNFVFISISLRITKGKGKAIKIHPFTQCQLIYTRHSV